MNYYNDNDPTVCEWMRELIEEGLVPDGEETAFEAIAETIRK